jgi:hypothetical protein
VPQLLERTDAQHLAAGAVAEERHGGMEEPFDLQRVDVLHGRGLVREGEMPSQQPADVIGARVIDRDHTVRHAPRR